MVGDDVQQREIWEEGKCHVFSKVHVMVPGKRTVRSSSLSRPFTYQRYRSQGLQRTVGTSSLARSFALSLSLLLQVILGPIAGRIYDT